MVKSIYTDKEVLIMNQIKFHKRLGLILDEIYDIFNSSTRQEQLNALLLKKTH